jgi:hypothetical protein
MSARWVRLRGTSLVGRVRDVHDETGAVDVGDDRWWPEDSIDEVGPFEALRTHARHLYARAARRLAKGAK